MPMLSLHSCVDQKVDLRPFLWLFIPISDSCLSLKRAESLKACDDNIKGKLY